MSERSSTVNLAHLFSHDGLGVMATASADGSVNTAVYARPHIMGDDTLVWGMTDGRTYRNISRNPRASFLFKIAGPGFNGLRLALELLRTEEEGELLEQIRKRTDEVVGQGAGASVTHAAWFRVVETRPLI
jgi:hypothetical protein